MEIQHKTQSIGLKFYLDKNISPVHQNIEDLEKHFQIRQSLYRMLGLLPLFIKSKTILEVAAGSGHNSLYISSLFPKTYHICEPNPVAVQDIYKLYEKFDKPHIPPVTFCQKLEDFDKQQLYDVVICEGWLGGMTEYEKTMLVTLSEFVVKDGILIISFFPPIGAISSVLRRLLAFRLITENECIETQTSRLQEAFSSHLNTLPHLSRSHEHWIQDSLLNPHIYIGPLWPRKIFATLTEKFEYYNSVPNITKDWRWYKSLSKDRRKYNNQFMLQYDKVSHNLIDYRFINTARHVGENRILEDLCIELVSVSQLYDRSGVNGYRHKIEPIINKIIKNLDDIKNKQTLLALQEVNILLQNDKVTSKQVSNMGAFKELFGREQCYMSLTRNY